MLSVEHLRVAYGRTEIVRDVSFAVPEGGVVALLGGNGAGKTTVLRALSGLVKPRAGSITFRGEKVTGRSPRDLVMRGLVQVPQGRFVWPGMSVQENLRLGAITRKTGIAEGLAAVFEVFPGLRDCRGTRAGQLSGGQQQMVAVGRAMMAQPRLLMMDEPSAGLAPRVVAEMVSAIRKLHRAGMAILLVEQNVGVAAALAGTALMLTDGKIGFSVAGTALADDPKIISSYLGRT